MADNTTPTGGKQPSAASKARATTKALQPDPDTSIPRMSLKETGFAALRTTMQGRILQQANMQFRYPQLIRVVEEMQYNPAVATALSTLNTLMCRAKIRIKPLIDETPVDQARREFLESVFHDMDDSWMSTMQTIATCLPYGYQVSEMVFRRRLGKNGSKFNDGLVGLAGLKHRPQNSISRWNFSEDGRDLVSISQSLHNMPNGFLFQSQMDEDGYIDIPREKFVLFRCDPKDSSPEGTSILIPAYLPYKEVTLLTEHLMRGISKDLGGIPYAQLPPRYMNPDATPEDAAVYTAVQTIITNLHQGQSSGIIFPKMLDETGNELFNFSILEQKTGNAYNINAVIDMLQQNILYVLGCGSISMGAVAGGSFSLQDSTTNLTALAVDFRLAEVANALTKQLIPTLFKLNGWQTDRMPCVEFSDISSVSLDEFSAYFQRIAAVGGIEITRDVLNKIREVGNFEKLPADMPVQIDKLSTTITGKQSNSAEGMAVGTNGQGTAKNPQQQDTSVANKENGP